MQYPIYVRREADTGFRASFPDFPRAHVRGDSFDELKCNAQEVVERMYDRSEQLIPIPTCSTSALHALDMDDGEGIWMFIDIDLARVTSKAVGLQFIVLESLLQQVDAAAKKRHMTRSAFFTLATLHELHSLRVKSVAPLHADASLSQAGIKPISGLAHKPAAVSSLSQRQADRCEETIKHTMLDDPHGDFA
jgi:predicted RNase H-like HicB family nuclease